MRRSCSSFALSCAFLALATAASPGCRPDGTDAGTDAATGTDATIASDAAATDASSTDASSTDAGTATTGRLTIEASGITGAVGQVVLVFVTAAGGGPMLGAICEPVTADPGSVSGVASVPAMMNPCDLGAEVVFDNGDYDLTGGNYTPGMMMPDECSTTTVTVMGDTTAMMPAFGACP